MPCKKKSYFYRSIKGKLSDVMMLVYHLENGEVVSQAQFDFALSALEICHEEITQKLREVYNEKVSS